MTPQEREALARTRYAILSAARASGVILMLIGIWIWNGDIVREGGYAPVGLPLFVLGALESLVLPQLLAKRWRTPK